MRAIWFWLRRRLRDLRLFLDSKERKRQQEKVMNAHLEEMRELRKCVMEERNSTSLHNTGTILIRDKKP